MNNQAQEEIFRNLVILRDTLAKSGVGLNVKALGEKFDAVIQHFSVAMAEEPPAAEPAPSSQLTNLVVMTPLNRREHVWLEAWKSVASTEACSRAEVASLWAQRALKEFDQTFLEPGERASV